MYSHFLKKGNLGYMDIWADKYNISESNMKRLYVIMFTNKNVELTDTYLTFSYVFLRTVSNCRCNLRLAINGIKWCFYILKTITVLTHQILTKYKGFGFFKWTNIIRNRLKK